MKQNCLPAGKESSLWILLRQLTDQYDNHDAVRPELDLDWINDTLLQQSIYPSLLRKNRKEKGSIEAKMRLLAAATI